MRGCFLALERLYLALSTLIAAKGLFLQPCLRKHSVRFALPSHCSLTMVSTAFLFASFFSNPGNNRNLALPITESMQIEICLYMGLSVLARTLHLLIGSKRLLT